MLILGLLTMAWGLQEGRLSVKGEVAFDRRPSSLAHGTKMEVRVKDSTRVVRDLGRFEASLGGPVNLETFQFEVEVDEKDVKRGSAVYSLDANVIEPSGRHWKSLGGQETFKWDEEPTTSGVVAVTPMQKTIILGSVRFREGERPKRLMGDSTLHVVIEDTARADAASIEIASWGRVIRAGETINPLTLRFRVAVPQNKVRLGREMWYSARASLLEPNGRQWFTTTHQQVVFTGESRQTLVVDVEQTRYVEVDESAIPDCIECPSRRLLEMTLHE
ncbi:MAG: uncharacterized protein KVP18_004902 [Porospora cf. gigantea A]|nr:MAG: hypothetical protein KVP18_004902 [Porospora cf. gigantea A]